MKDGTGGRVKQIFMAHLGILCTLECGHQIAAVVTGLCYIVCLGKNFKKEDFVLDILQQI